MQTSQEALEEQNEDGQAISLASETTDVLI